MRTVAGLLCCIKKLYLFSDFQILPQNFSQRWTPQTHRSNVAYAGRPVPSTCLPCLRNSRAGCARQPGTEALRLRVRCVSTHIVTLQVPRTWFPIQFTHHGHPGLMVCGMQPMTQTPHLVRTPLPASSSTKVKRRRVTVYTGCSVLG